MKKNQSKTISLAHGNGGKLTHDLIDSIFVSCFKNPILCELSDSAILSLPHHRLAFSTDGYVVKPLFFPGGDIGSLAVSGTVNDIAVAGGIPRFLSASFIIEEGFPLDDLAKIAQSMAAAAAAAEVTIVTGDTKVVEKGNVDGVYITTSGIGYTDDTYIPFSPNRIQPGDQVIINGTIGDHGIAILAAREDFPISTPLTSDCAPLNLLIRSLITALPPGTIRIMRDPTRGGIGTTLNEFVRNRPFGIHLHEESLPVKNEVRAICEMTGYDYLYIANEGKVLIIAAPEESQRIVSLLHDHELGKDASIIGTVKETNTGKVVIRTKIGGERIIDMLTGDMFPRIC
ncbi:MAG: hydrogenase expression/formation protein HypE [Spirochaetales bacterium]|nr:hydrogenase expression/formation protein HypE [Spirochaetales bacterium]